MVADLVPLIDDRGNDIRVMLGNPAGDEEGRLELVAA
jgi:hypothetical protein